MEGTAQRNRRDPYAATCRLIATAAADCESTLHALATGLVGENIEAPGQGRSAGGFAMVSRGAGTIPTRPAGPRFRSWTKLTMGGLLTLAGAFFPTPGRWSKGADGSGTVKAGPISVAIKGGVRFAVVVGGIVVLLGAAFEGIQHPEFAKTAKKLQLDEPFVRTAKKFHLDDLIAEVATKLHLEQSN
jgi:hypothetical protein